MKTTIKRIKSVLQNNATLSAYIKKFEFVAPRLLPEIPSSLVPYIGISGITTAESWIAQRKQAIHNVELYIVTYLQQTENAIIGDSVKKGLLEVTEDVQSAIRAHRLPENSVNYLSKPIEITGIDYSVASYGDSTYLFVASISLQCVRLFDITLP